MVYLAIDMAHMLRASDNVYIIHISSNKVYILYFIMVYLAIDMAHMLRASDNVYIIYACTSLNTQQPTMFIFYSLYLRFISSDLLIDLNRGLYFLTIMQHASCNCKGIFDRVYILYFTMLCCYLSSI